MKVVDVTLRLTSWEKDNTKILTSVSALVADLREGDPTVDVVSVDIDEDDETEDE